MSVIELPEVKIKQRKIDQKQQQLAIDNGLHPVVARIVAARPMPEDGDSSQVFNPKINLLQHPHAMQDMQLAATRVARAITNQEYIGIETDHDCDGQTSHAVLYYNLVNHFKHPRNRLYSYIGHRLKEGYGLSQSVADRIMASNPRPNLVITADNGSADEARISQLKQVGIDVIITDHHAIPIDNFPRSAYAFLNPTRSDCQYDSYIAGCMVAWLLMAATRLELQKGAGFASVPQLCDSLDYVAVGTVADCVSFARSNSNRAVVKYGLQLLRQKTKPCWQALQTILPNNITSEDIGFKIAPLLNSDGRLDSAFGSVSFLLAGDVKEGRRWLQHLTEHNKRRRGIQKEIIAQGMLHATRQVQQGACAISVFLENGHSGVHGIAASKIKDSFGRPTAFLAPKEKGLITGSLRGVDGFNIKQALDDIALENPGLFYSYGGHSGAGGVTFMADKLQQFHHGFELAAKKQLTTEMLGPVVWTDGTLIAGEITLQMLDHINQLQPFGREFESPCFQSVAEVMGVKIIGDGSHLSLTLQIADSRYRAVWFNACSNLAPVPVQQGQKITCAFKIIENNFRSMRNCELQIMAVAPIS